MIEQLDKYMENHVSIEQGYKANKNNHSNLTSVTITVGERYRYVFTPRQYAAIAEAIFMNPPENVIWQAQMTSDMVSGMTGDQIDEMVRTLDESVELALDDYELENV